MEPIEYKEFGNKNYYLNPIWACLTNPDKNLINYYNKVLNCPFNKKRFNRSGVFRNIGTIKNKERFSNFKFIRCLDMPIKMKENKEYRIPLEFEQFLEPIYEMISFENIHNKNLIDFYTYLTIDQTISNGKEFHREGGLHVDGFQGPRINPKVICDRSYFVTDCDCPSFWNQSFPTVKNLDDTKYNLFKEFDKTKHYSSEIKCLPFNIYFMDCYSVHSAGKVQNEKRTFCRVSFSAREFDRLGNSHNNCFDYNWKMVERNFPKNLI